MKSIRQQIYERAEKYAKDNLVKIDVEAGDYDGSQKCQHIARQNAEFKTGYYGKVVVTLSFIPNSGVNIHFINKRNIPELYIDDTLGYLSQRNFYYLVEILNLKDIYDLDMNKILQRQKQTMLDKLFTKDEQKKIGIELKHI